MIRVQPLTKERLDKFRCLCGKPDCKNLHLTCPAHFGVPFNVYYEDGVLTLCCPVDQAEIYRIEVAG